MSKILAPYGVWKSNISADNLATENCHISQLQIDGYNTYWIETRPNENGRNVLVCCDESNVIRDVFPNTNNDLPFNTRCNVHEYGGKSYCVKNNIIIATNINDGIVYKYDLNNTAKGLIPLAFNKNLRFGDFELDLKNNFVYAVCENHENIDNITNYLVAINLDDNCPLSDKITTIFSGTDFVSSPSISKDGKFFAWISWQHPNMPWDKSKLHVAKLSSNISLENEKILVDIDNVSVCQPKWTDDNELIHINDASGYSNVYITQGFNSSDFNLRTRHLSPSAKNFSPAMWVLGLQTYDILDSDHLVVSWCENGKTFLGTMNIRNGQLEQWQIKYYPKENIACNDARIVALVNSPFDLPIVLEIKNGTFKTLSRKKENNYLKEDISIGEHITWNTTNGDICHGFLYMPMSAKYTGIDSEKPPLLVEIHGGPTSQANCGFKLEKQFWTNRGFAILDVNYRGSTGYGRKYQRKLEGNWGIYDIEDCITGVKYLISKGLIDPNCVAIHGGSAGGYTTLTALTCTDIFTAGVSYYGVSDLKLLAKHTHKFESQYLFGLLGSKNLNDKVWSDRSPIYNIDKITAPLLILQGSADKVVPVEQAQIFYEKMMSNNKKIEFVLYEGEGHGFVRDCNIIDSYNKELDFYLRVWNKK